MNIVNTLLKTILEKEDLPLFVLVILAVIIIRALIIAYTLKHPGKGRKGYLNITRNTYAEPYQNKLERFLNHTAKNWCKDSNYLTNLRQPDLKDNNLRPN